jgi:hypothetical protein
MPQESGVQTKPKLTEQTKPQATQQADWLPTYDDWLN